MTAPSLILNQADLLDPLAAFNLDLPVLPAIDIYLVASYQPSDLSSPATNFVETTGGSDTDRGTDGLVWPIGVQRFGLPAS